MTQLMLLILRRPLARLPRRPLRTVERLLAARTLIVRLTARTLIVRLTARTLIVRLAAWTLIVRPLTAASARLMPLDDHLPPDIVRDIETLQHAAVARCFLRRNLIWHDCDTAARTGAKRKCG